MKNVLMVLMFIFLGNTLQAQHIDEEPAETYEKQFGVNVTNFVLTFLSFNQPSNNTPSVLFLYKKNKNGKRKRFGFAGRINWRKDNEGDRFFSSSMNFNFGREFGRKIGKRWNAYAGYETILSGSYNHIIEADFNEEEEKEFNRSAGIAWKGLVGLEYHLNDRLSLLTETSYGISFNYILGSVPNRSPSKQERYSAGTFYSPPTSLVLSYHF